LTRRRRGGESRVRREEKRREKGRLVLSERDHAQLFTQRSHLVSALSSVCLSLCVLALERRVGDQYDHHLFTPTNNKRRRKKKKKSKQKGVRREA